MNVARKYWTNGWIAIVAGMVCGAGSRGAISLLEPGDGWGRSLAEPVWAIAIALVLVGLGLLIQSRILYHCATTGILSALAQVFSQRLTVAQRTRAEWLSAAGKLILEMILGSVAAWWVFQHGISELHSPHKLLTGGLSVVLWLTYLSAGIGGFVGLWMLRIGVAAPQWRGAKKKGPESMGP